ncbi:MAG: peptidoglycan editing factor PgeF [Rhodocyclaceae bacterium]|nr:peptidoglycan editing factor PgeF [Rhodocyclaceae bacterium]MDP1956760.1 peptidoglycan editing factor PgeF [Rhodocyclaceae bacterium]
MALEFITPDWPAPPNVRAFVTTRPGGVSQAPWDSFNLADHVGDDPAAVAENRRLLSAHLPGEPVWLKQVHGNHCRDAAQAASNAVADASFTRAPGVVCAVLTADCLPVLLCDDSGSVVAAAHAGWRGLADGVIEATVAAMGVPGERLMAWLGPAIGPMNFEVGGEVREIFVAHDAQATAAFVTRPNGKWLCDITLLARQRLAAIEIRRITSADFCTVRDTQQFFSYRRDGVTGRQACLIWIDSRHAALQNRAVRSTV